MSSQSSSPILFNPSPINDDDLFKRFKLKHHRTKSTTYENDVENGTDPTNSDEWTSQSSTPELDVEPHFKDYYRTYQPNPNRQCHLLTPDIDELQRKENELVQTLTAVQQQVKRR